MTLSTKSLQKKREKKKKKRKLKVSQVFSSSAINYKHWEIGECWLPVELWKTGLGYVIITRVNSEGSVTAGVYLVDTFCLGVKDCFIRMANTDELHILIKNAEDACGELECVAPAYAISLIHKAVEYASKIGFKPHSDFMKAKKLLTGIPIDETYEFVFGRDGEPIYIQGPHETQADARKIMEILESNSDAENYNFIVEAPEVREV
jgi:hypothetical protein